MTRTSIYLCRLTAFMALMISSTLAHATSNIECTGVNSDADVSILIGGGPILNALEASAGINDSVVSTYDIENVQHGNIVQFSANEHELSLDLMDDQAEKVLASVRLVRIDDEENDPVQAGYLHMPDEAPVAITCDGP